MATTSTGHLLQSQQDHLLRILAEQSAQLDKLRGTSGELQMRLNQLQTAAAPKSAGASSKGSGVTKERQQKGHGSTEQPKVMLFLKIEADRSAPQYPEGRNDSL